MSSNPRDSNEPDDQPSTVPQSTVPAGPDLRGALLQQSTPAEVSAEESCTTGDPDPEHPPRPEESIVQPGVLIGQPLPQLEGTLRSTEMRYSGGYSDVHQGTWTHEEGEIAVAIKRLRKQGIIQSSDPISAQARFETRIRRETTIWRQATHPNILPFIGYQIHDGEPMLVSPWCQNGSLGEYLRKHPELTDIQKLRLLKDVARGLAYLHSRDPPIAHGDIKPENVMIQDDLSAAITDFGLSRVMTDIGIPTGFTTGVSPGGTIGFQAGELFTDGSRPTNMSDVYAFGGLILSTMSGNRPFVQQRTAGMVVLLVLRGERPRPEDHPQLPRTDPLWDLMNRCWSQEPDQRPSMDMIIQELEAEIQRRSA